MIRRLPWLLSLILTAPLRLLIGAGIGTCERMAWECQGMRRVAWARRAGDLCDAEAIMRGGR